MIRGRGAAWAASLGAALFAALALMSGMDRHSEHRLSASRFVPDPLQVEAARSLAGAALARGDYAAARNLATAAVRRDPMDARGVGLLASAMELSGDRQAAAKAFAWARALGWREPLTQIYEFTRALGRGDAEAAAVRLDALLRAHPDFALAQTYLVSLEASPAGRRALVERLRVDTRWAAHYLTASEVTDDVLRARARFIASEAQRGLRFGCDRSLPMVRELAQRNHRAEAEALLAAQCAEAQSASLLVDGDFERFGEDNPTGLGWRRHGSGDTRVTPAGGSDRGVELANRSGVTRLMLSQPVALAAGQYLVTGDIGGEDDGRVLVSIDCGTPARPGPGTGRIGTEGVVLAAGTCPDQIFSLWLRPGDDPVTLGALALEPR